MNENQKIEKYLTTESLEKLKIEFQNYPHTPASTQTTKFRYGTAGFRTNAKQLPAVFFRMGVYASLRSLQLKKSVGLMCTASHNPASDNGLKCVDPNGDMLPSIYEGFCEDLVNCKAFDEFLKLLNDYVSTYSVDFSDEDIFPKVHVGRDTRIHSVELTSIAIKGAMLLNALVENHELVTTPQLHYIVLHDNEEYVKNTNILCRPKEQGYWETLTISYQKLLQTSKVKKERKWIVDCACGVGYNKIIQLQKLFSSRQSESLLFPALIAINSSEHIKGLNNDCGADFVQKTKSLPKIHDTKSERKPCQVSLDGDADRIVFYFNNSSNSSFDLCDGDKIALLVAQFLQEEMSLLNLDLTFGIVQTAYANGASTNYGQQCGIPVIIAKTGVKYVHRACVENFNVGIYFEANGHGTVLFQHDFYTAVNNIKSDDLPTERQRIALERLLVLPSLINQAVGDALSNLLLVDFILLIKEWDIPTWNQTLYTDLPSRQLKLVIKDRTLIHTNENETKVISPDSLQVGIDEMLTKLAFPYSRCFVRPSGTENVVRVYAEANTQENADMIARETSKIVELICNDSSSKL